MIKGLLVVDSYTRYENWSRDRLLERSYSEYSEITLWGVSKIKIHSLQVI